MKLLIHREKQQPSNDCTLGLIFLPGELSLVTIERPWIPGAGKGGTKGVSCVPPGTYELVRHNTEAHPNTWALVNEDLDVYYQPGPGTPPHARTAVLIHPANWAHELRGCIAPGTRTTTDGAGRYMVQESRKAMRLLQQHMPWENGHTLEIR